MYTNQLVSSLLLTENCWQVGGTLASVGQRMIQGAAKMMAAQFFTALEAEAQTEQGEPPPEHGFFRTALRFLTGLLRRIFKKVSQ